MTGKQVVAIGIAALIAGIGCSGYTHYKVQQEEQRYRHELQQLKEQYEVLAVGLNEVNNDLDSTKENIQNTHEHLQRLQEEVSRGRERTAIFTVTAYDLSVTSCGKVPGSPGYGMTAMGVSLEGHTLESARAIAVDPSIIPLGSRVRISFMDDDMTKYNGIYTAVDTGSAVRGNHIDLFAGEGAGDLALSIGRREARVTIL